MMYLHETPTDLKSNIKYNESQTNKDLLNDKSNKNVVFTLNL